MSDTVIRVENLSKKYLVGHQSAERERYTALRDVIGREARNFLRKAVDVVRGREIVQGDQVEEFWALKDVNFEVKRGEVLGIIGRNGAGKSTLLKILSKITEPTAGRVTLYGRVATLLEVGTGFHPELTGRENIYLNGAVLGMKRADIKKRFDKIVAFAEVEKFLDTPVKRFSSGMYVRLAFAVAAHLDPEILIVDEVLAVGDAEFQKKCIGKLSEVATSGRTVLFVSHNMTAVRTLCSQVAMIDRGRMPVMGEPSVIIGRYSESYAKSTPREHAWDCPDQRPGNDRIRLRRIELQNESSSADEFAMSDDITIEVEYYNLVESTRLAVNFALYSVDGSEVLEDWSIHEETWAKKLMPCGMFSTKCRIPANLLNVGTYSLRVIFFDAEAVRPLYEYDQRIIFSVYDNEERDVLWHGKYIGHVHPKLYWLTQSLGEGERAR